MGPSGKILRFEVRQLFSAASELVLIELALISYSACPGARPVLGALETKEPQATNEEGAVTRCLFQVGDQGTERLCHFPRLPQLALKEQPACSTVLLTLKLALLSL